MKFNFYAFKAIYMHEMDRFKRTLGQSLISPVLSTSLYFIVFGSVIGGYVENIDGISYGSYIVPGGGACEFFVFWVCLGHQCV